MNSELKFVPVSSCINFLEKNNSLDLRNQRGLKLQGIHFKESRKRIMELEEDDAHFPKKSNPKNFDEENYGT